MEYRKSMIIIMLAIFLFSIAAASASEVNDVSVEDTGEIELEQENGISAPMDDSNALGAGEGTYSDLRDEIGNGGNITLTKDTYTYNRNDGDTIKITDSGVIDGNGAVIDMAGFSKRAFEVTASKVTFKNLTIKNVHAGGNGGAIHFTGSATVINCNFINNRAQFGGALYFVESSSATITDCNFVDNTASFGSGGALHLRCSGNVTNCNFTGNKAEDGGAIIFTSVTRGNVTNCNFVNNTASSSAGLQSNGGAIEFSSRGTVTNCNFTGNRAGYNGHGGAVYFYSGGAATNCNFIDNSAMSQGGGAFISTGDTTVTNCNFTGNNASEGSALYFWHYGSAKNVYDSCLLNNRADAEALEVVKNNNNITITFKGNDHVLNAISTYYDYEVTVRNVTYWGANGISNTGASVIKPSRSNNVAGQNVTVGVFVNDALVLYGVYVTDENGMIVLPITAGDNYYISARHDTDSYYTEAERTVSTMKFFVNVTSQTSGRTANITAKSNIPYEITKAELAFLVPDAGPVVATYAGNGTWWALHTFADSGRFEVSASVAGVENVTVNNATIICKPDSALILDNLDLYYGQSRNLTVETEGATGIMAWINGVEVPTDKYSVLIEGLPAGNHTLTVATIPDDDHGSLTKTVNITVYKASSSLTVADIVFNYTGSGSVRVDFDGATGFNAEVIGQPNDVVEITGNEITVSGLGAGNYVLSVTTIPDANHTAVTRTAGITVNRIAPEIIIINESIDLNATEPVRLDDLAYLIPGDIGELTFASDDGNILAIENGYVFGRDIGTATIIVSFAGSENYTAAESKAIRVTVIFENAGISVENSTLDVKAGDTFKLDAATDPGWLNVVYKSSDESVVTVDENGIVTVVGAGTAVITMSVGNGADYALNSTNVTVTVRKLSTGIAGAPVSTVYNVNKYLVVTLKDENGNPVSGAAVTVVLNGAKTYTTDKNGQIRVSTNGLVPKSYTAKVTFSGSSRYAESACAVKVTVKKATPKLTAKKKTFKKSTKVKKYSIVLKTNKGKAMKKVKVRLKIKGKRAIIVKTNSKGKATFKIKRLAKKGTYRATVSVKANKYYNRVVKKVIIKVK